MSLIGCGIPPKIYKWLLANVLKNNGEIIDLNEFYFTDKEQKEWRDALNDYMLLQHILRGNCPT